MAKSLGHMEDKGGKLSLFLAGHWHAITLADAAALLDHPRLVNAKNLRIDGSALEGLDTAGAWLLKRFMDHLQAQKGQVELARFSATHQALLNQAEVVPKAVEAESQKLSWLMQQLDVIGRGVVFFAQTAEAMLSFLGHLALCIMALFRGGLKFRWTPFVHHLQHVGYSALPIVGLISFLIGIVLVYQGADQLSRFGAEIFTVDLLAISVMREIGILLTAIVVAGRSGSAFTAQIGFMKLNQEVDAMKVLGLEPMELLVIPRVLALMVALPLLTFYANIMALIGGAMMSFALIDLTWKDFFHHLNLSIKPWNFWAGMIKAPVFAFIIGFVGCFEGLRVSGGAESVGQHTTQSVVESIFLVIVLDAVFSIIFSIAGV